MVASPDNTAVSTYAVAADGASVSQVGATVGLSARADDLQFTADRRFAYTIGTGANDSTIAVYAADVSGALRTPAIQTATVPLRTGFLIHPSGKFAYQMKPGPSDYLSIQSSLYLQPIDAATGVWTGDAQLLQAIGPAWTSESLSRFSKDGATLFDEIDGSGPHATTEIAFRKSAVDSSTGALRFGNVFWTYNVYNDPNTSRSVALGDKLLAFAHVNGVDASDSSIDVFAVSDTTSTATPSALVHCTSQMLAICGTATDVRLDRSEQFVFATDAAHSRVRVLRIDVANKQLADTGNSIPHGASDSSVSFGGDGTLVYAPSNNDIQIYRFDANTGTLTPGAVIHVGSAFWMYPAP